MRDMSLNWSELLVRYYHRIAIAAAVVVVVGLLVTTPFEQWLPIGALAILLFAVLTELMPVPLLYGGAQVTIGFPIVCTVIALYGVLPAILVDSMPTFIAGVLLNRNYPLRHRLRWSMFNAAQSALSAGAAGVIYYQIRGSIQDVLSLQAINALLIAAVVYLMVNALLVSVAGSLYDGEPLRSVWQNVMRVVWPTYMLLMPLSLMLILLMRSHQVAGFFLLAVPFMAARECFRLRIQRVRDYIETIRALGLLVQHAHPYTSGHLKRSSNMAVSVARRLGVPARHIVLLPEATALHDLGKVGIDENVLNKILPLTPEDWQMIREHPLKGAEIIRSIRHMEPVALWIALHHERPDGKGYPFGLQGGEIPIESHIIAVVDAFDAMLGDDEKSEQRPYRKPKTVPEAIAELQCGAGKQFHPDVVNAFIESLRAGELGAEYRQHAISATAVQQAVA